MTEYNVDTDTDINEGIRETVKLLRSMQYNTTDSGDGKTHLCECDLPVPYVHIVLKEGEDMVEASKALLELIEIHTGKNVWKREIPDPAAPGETYNPSIQASYDPVSNVAILSLFGLCDADLFGYTLEVTKEAEGYSAKILEIPEIITQGPDYFGLYDRAREALGAYWNVTLEPGDAQISHVEVNE